MAAACDVGEVSTATSSQTSDEFSETQFVAQAITELQELIPASHQVEPLKTVSSDVGTGTVQYVTSPNNGADSSTEQQFVAIVTNSDNKDVTDRGIKLISSSELVAVPDDQIDRQGSNENGQSSEQNLTAIPGQAEVIYFIEDGTFARAEDRQLVDTAVQANDYEIERRSGRLPARKRVIPYKFRDYRSGDASEGGGSDSDYEPESKPKIKKIRTEVTPSRPRGRPRKYPAPVSSHIASKEAVGREAVSNKEAAGERAGSQLANKEENTAESNTEPSSTDDTIPDIKNIPLIAEAIDDESDRKETSELPLTDSSVHPVSVERRGRGRPRGPDYDRAYKCLVCGKVFSQKGNLKTHMRIHSDERPYPCPEEGCFKSFRSNESLRRHILSHQGVKLFECNVCNKKFSSNTSLQEHISRHTNTKPYECKECHRHFRQISCLRRHLITHSSDLPYACSLCNRRFSQLVYLRSHMKVHTGEKPFSCDICGKKFAHQSDVSRHKVIHTGQKPYVCEYCGSPFSDRSSKRRHEKEHANKKPYNCQLCQDSFKRAGQLKSHLNRKHSGILHLKIEKDGNNVLLKYQNEEETRELSDFGESQQRIVKLIENLHSKSVVQHVEIHVPPHADGQKNSDGQAVVIDGDHVTEIGQSDKVDGVIEAAGGIPIELQGVEIQEADASEEQAYIALADLAESLIDKGQGGENVEYSYRIIQAAGEDGEQQIQVVQYTPSEETDIPTEARAVQSEDQPQSQTQPEPSTHIPVPAEQETVVTDTQIELKSPTAVSDSPEKQPETATSQSIVDLGKTVDYVRNPDFSSQGYYNWLSNFTELCKLVPMPLDVSLFQKISQVHKTLSDVMATPSGVIADKENFRVLMNISKELSTIINEHLVYVLQNLNQDEKEQTEK